SQVVGGYANGEIRRWKIEDGQQQGPTMQASHDGVDSVVVSQDGRRIVSGDRGRKAIVWNVTTHAKVRELEHRGWVHEVDVSSDCTKIASADWYIVEIFNMTSGIRPLPTLPHPHVAGVKFSPDGSQFASASESYGFRVYNTYNGDILFDSGQKGATGSWSRSALAWSSDGQQLFVANKGKIICFDLSKSFFSEWSIHENRSPVYIASNGRFIACATGSSISLWDCVSHEQISGIISYTTEIKRIALSPSGVYLACGNGKN
ncbi:hypothetical protein M404DRAFT_106348, partial [Pisolithus tinctorius Marx 270]